MCLAKHAKVRHIPISSTIALALWIRTPFCSKGPKYSDIAPAIIYPSDLAAPVVLQSFLVRQLSSALVLGYRKHGKRHLLVSVGYALRFSPGEPMVSFDQALLGCLNLQLWNDAVVVFVYAAPCCRDVVHQCLEVVGGNLLETRSSETGG